MMVEMVTSTGNHLHHHIQFPPLSGVGKGKMRKIQGAYGEDAREYKEGSGSGEDEGGGGEGTSRRACAKGPRESDIMVQMVVGTGSARGITSRSSDIMPQALPVLVIISTIIQFSPLSGVGKGKMRKI